MLNVLVAGMLGALELERGVRDREVVARAFAEVVDDAVARGAVGSCVTVTCAVTVTRCEETAATCRPCTSITPSTPIMCVRSSPISTLAGVSSMRIATERRRSVSARGADEDSNQERGDRVGARPA